MANTKFHAKCTICGEPMPEGEEMFNYHGFSGGFGQSPLRLDVESFHKQLCELRDRRIPAAPQRIYDGHGCMRLPAEDTDPDIVLADCKKSIESLLSAGQQAEKYNELLMAVENKYPNETRHETALRYIKQAEQNTRISLPLSVTGARREF